MAQAVYELTTLEIKVFSNPNVYTALQQHLPEAGGELLGVFAAGRILNPRTARSQSLAAPSAASIAN